MVRRLSQIFTDAEDSKHECHRCHSKRLVNFYYCDNDGTHRMLGCGHCDAAHECCFLPGVEL